jgi:hypothetical protein
MDNEDDELPTNPYIYAPDFTERLIAEVERYVAEVAQLTEQYEQAKASGREHADFTLEHLELYRMFKGLTEEQQQELAKHAALMRFKNESNGH